jgi:serine/threonine protein kinase
MLQEARFGRRRISDIDCLNYLKELMWGVHLLHEKYNLVHRALLPANILLDQNGQLKLASLAYCVPCYDPQGHYANYVPRSKYPKPGFSLEELAAD